MNVLVNEESLKSIGNAIREKTGADQETKYLPSAMADAISSIVTDTTLPPQTIEVSPSTNTQDVTADSGYQLSMVRVNPITSDLLHDLDNDFAAENIKEGVNLFGIEGEVKPSVDFSVVSATPETVLAGKVFYNDQGKQATGSIPPVEAGTPSISIGSGTGVITASVSQSTGYVQGATNTSTLELSTYSGEKVSPTLEDQTIVEAGVYTTSAIEVAGITSSLLAGLDSDFVASNIVSGVNLFGLDGTAEVGGPDMSQLSATADHVLEGKTFYGQDKTLTTGKMPELKKTDFTHELGEDGVITASADKSGYVTEGFELSPVKLDLQKGWTVTPGTTSQTAVPKGYYTTGDVIVEAISSLYKKAAIVTATPTSGTSIKFTHSLTDVSSSLNFVAHLTNAGTVNSDPGIAAFSSYKDVGSLSSSGYIHATIIDEDGALNYNVESVTYTRAINSITITLSSSTQSFRIGCEYRAIIMIG